MFDHAKETTMLWDSFNLSGFFYPELRITRTDNVEPTPQYVSDPHELSDLCSICEEGFIGRDGYCPNCGN